MHQKVGHMKIPEVNILIGNYKESDLRIFFDSVTSKDIFLNIPKDWTWSKILVKIGVFFSIQDAANNGWDIPINNGFSDIVTGNPEVRVCALKIID